MKPLIIGLAALGVLVGVGQADGSIVDQQNAPSFNGGFNGHDSFLVWQQEVIAGVQGQLVGFDIAPQQKGSSARVFVNVGAPWQGDANEFETVFTSTAEHDWMFFDTSAAKIYLDSGESFVIGIAGTDGGLGFWGAVFSNYPGALYLNGSPFSQPTYDIAFRTHMEPGVIPEPSSALMFAMVAACVLVFAWRRRRTK